MRALAIASLLLSLAAGRAAAQALPPPPAPPTRSVHAVYAPSAIVVDGVLDEAAWSAAEPVTQFVQGDPVEGAVPSQRTEVRVLFDHDALYIGAHMFDSSADSIVRELSRHDQGTRSDKFLVYLDPYRDRRSGYYFGLNAAGTQYDGTLYNDAWSDDSWDAVWEGRVHSDAQGWTLEMRIPFSQLRFPHSVAQVWGINFMRQMGRGFENIYFVCRPHKTSGFVSLFAELTGLENINLANSIEFVPYASSKSEFTPAEPQDPFHGSRTVSGLAGGDLRMPVGGSMTLNATVNPDFGQVEVDPAVVNLSDVETYFPEKRPFFVEGSSIFDAGQQGGSDYWGFNFWEPTFFYSRRIGHAPEGSLPDNVAYSDVPSGTTILGAAKLSGKPVDGLNIGVLQAITSRENASLQMNDLSRDQFEVEPPAYYGVFRALKEYPGRRHGLGMITTVTYRGLDGSVLRDQFNRDAVVSAIDGWHFLDKNQVWVLSGWAGGSLLQGTAARITDVQIDPVHYYQRPDARSFSVDSNATSLTGYGARVWLNKEKGNWISNSALGMLSPGLDVSDLGFEAHSDWINGHAGVGYKWTEPTKYVKNHMVLGAIFGSSDFDGNLTTSGAWARAFWWFTNNWTLNPSIAYNPESVNPRRARGGPLMLNKPGLELYLAGDTDGSRTRYYSINYDQYTQPEENSYSYSVNPFFTYKPRANLRFDLGPGYQVSRDGAFYVDAVADPSATNTYGTRYVFARLDQQILSINVRLNVSFTPYVSLQFFGQPLISSGRYSDFRELARPKSLDFTGPGGGPWTYDPVTRVYDPDGAGPTDGEVKDFNSTSVRGNAVFRWEYRPGSAFYLVWTQQRADDASMPDFDFSGSMRRMFSADASNIFLAKVTYYLGL
jgi:hypothetical protein